MEALRKIRKTILKYYKEYENIILIIIKFLMGVIIYNYILGGINYHSMFSRFNSGAFGFIYIVILSFAFAFLPRTLNYLIIISNIGMSVSLYPFVAGFVLIALLSVLVFYGRLAPRESIVILITFFLFSINAHYLIPLVAGLYLSITAFIPIIIGGFLYAFYQATLNTIDLINQGNLADSDIISQFIFINKNIMTHTFESSPFFVIGFILAISFFAVYFISKLSIDYNREIGIAFGGFFSLIGMIFIKLTVTSSFSLIFAIIMIILSCIVAYFITFFETILDYESSDKVLFQDEDNYYFVKIVPKIDID